MKNKKLKMENNNSDLEQLNENFAFSDGENFLRFKMGEGGILLIEIHNDQASAVISMQGAHVLSWVPVDKEEVIWVSDDAVFASGRSVRGGIPVCWPWFGAHEDNASFPAHGFARTVMWQVLDVQQISSGETQIAFMLDTRALDESYQQMWPSATVVEYRVTIAKTLKLELETFNHSDEEISIGQALHTYFKVDDVRNTAIDGLDDRDYLDKTDGFKRKTQSGPVTLSDEVDRVYLQTPDDIIIDDTKRKIMIKKRGSLSSIVWNPWKLVAEKMGDLGKDGYLSMLCVESANAAEDIVSIGSGQHHNLSVTYSL